MRPTLALMLLVLVAATGCGSSGAGPAGSVKTGPAPATSTAGGWKAYAPSGGGYRVEIPGTWTTLDAASLLDSSALGALTKANPGMDGALAALEQMARRPGALVAIDTSAAGTDQIRSRQFAANILVRRADLGSSASDATLLAGVVAQNRSAAAGLPTLTGAPKVAHSTIAGRPSGSVTYSFSLMSAEGRRNPITEEDDIVVSDGIAYIISCTTLTGDVRRLRPSCAHARSSFAFTG